MTVIPACRNVKGNPRIVIRTGAGDIEAELYADRAMMPYK